MRAFVLAVTALLAVLLFASAFAQAPAHEIESRDDWFAVQFPAEPKYSEKFVKADDSFTAKTWLLAHGPNVYLVSVMLFPPFTGPRDPNERYYTKLLKAYGGVGEVTVREQRAVTVAGHRAVEGIVDNPARNWQTLVDIISISDRLYIISSGGRPGHAASSEAQRFRDSFRLTNY